MSKQTLDIILNLEGAQKLQKLQANLKSFSKIKGPDLETRMNSDLFKKSQANFQRFSKIANTNLDAIKKKSDKLGIDRLVKGFDEAQQRIDAVKKSTNLFGDTVSNHFKKNYKDVNTLINEGFDPLIKAGHKRASQIKKTNDLLARQAKKEADLKEKQIKLNKHIGKIGQLINKSSRDLVKFNGNMLSLMFFGMQLKKTFGDALKSIFDGYKKIVPENSKFNKEVTKLSANWGFFKYQLADAFVQSGVFDILIAGALKLVHWFQTLSPATKNLIVILTGLGLVIGSVMMAIGVLVLGIAPLINIFGVAGLAGAASTLAGGLGLVISNLKRIALFKLSDLPSALKSLSTKAVDVATNFGTWLSSLKGKDIKKLISGLGSKITAFAGTVLGASLIIGASLWAAFEISKKGVELLSLKYTSTLNTWKGTALDAAVGIAGVFGIVLPGAIEGIFEWALRAAFNFGQGLADAVIAGFSGGSMKDAFMAQWDDFSMNDILTRNISNPIKALGDAAVTLKKQWGWVEPIKKATSDLSKIGTSNQSSGVSQTINNTVIVTLDEAVASGQITKEQKTALSSLGITGI